MDTRAIEQEVDHRPWPLPKDPWVLMQRWERMLFAHWPVPVEVLQASIPDPLVVDEHDGSGWLGMTPFHLLGSRLRFMPPVPGAAVFPELNLRTYVRYNDRPGVYFFTLETGSQLAALAARAIFKLPYRTAEMHVLYDDDWTLYHSDRDAGDAVFTGRYGPTGPVYWPLPDTLEHFLVERYALYVVLRGGKVLRGDIHHRRWPLQPAEAEVEANSVPAAHSFDVSPDPPVLHYAGRQDALIWSPKMAG
jgi:hypothetical protein